METIAEQDIQEIPLSSPFFRAKVARFLEDNGLRPEVLDSYYALQSSDGSLIAGAGLAGDVVKCVAVCGALRSEGLLTPLLSHLVSQAAAKGILNLKVFTKPEYRAVFESLGFKLLASAPLAILMENGRGLEEYCKYLSQFKASGVIVMNANPFTLGHKYLVERAAALCSDGSASLSSQVAGTSCPTAIGHLVVIPVREDLSSFPYSERFEMIRRACQGLATVVDGSAYQISAATFPTYFLKDLSDAADTQMRLDIDLFGRWIAPALGASVRFVGSEPEDKLTARYNALMKEMLPAYGVKVVQIPRLESPEGGIISASQVREALAAGQFARAASLAAESSRPFVMGALAERALLAELNAPLKPGLVGPDSNGAHSDMDYKLMLASIHALRPYWARMAEAAGADQLRSLGIAAEEAMLAATGGVNTHRGAIFALGLALNAAFLASTRPDLDSEFLNSADPSDPRDTQLPENQRIIQINVSKIAYIVLNNSLKHNELPNTPLSHGQEATNKFGVKGARQMALEGYKQLFEDWLPYYRSLNQNEFQIQKTLLRIMSTLDDTCIIHRVGYERAQRVKAEAAKIAGQAEKIAGQAGNDNDAMPDAIRQLCAQYAVEGISPGGAADMLALTIFINSILKTN
ncbi:MAG: triphosphoribosyl-dephospho-CoA synthase [Bacteroidales bacterium]|nr:triphosphoribosyl-dephospho-CoA synthase [Bacteroidales bacterium]